MQSNGVVSIWNKSALILKINNQNRYLRLQGQVKGFTCDQVGKFIRGGHQFGNQEECFG